MCHLIQQDTDAVDEKTRTLFATLAYRMISKAAEQIQIEQVLHILASCSGGFSAYLSTGSVAVSWQGIIHAGRGCPPRLCPQLDWTSCGDGQIAARRYT